MVVLLVIILLFALMCVLPVGAHAVYSVAGPEVSLRIGPVSIPIIPKTEKKKTEKQLEKEALKAEEKQKKKAEKKTQKAAKKDDATKKPKQPIGGKLEFFKELLGIGLSALNCIRRKLIMKDLVLYFTVGGQGDDAAKAALLYGRAWAAVGALTPVLENTFDIRNRDIQVSIDFFAPENNIYAEATVLLRVGDLLWISANYGIRALAVLLKQKRKGRK